jgi:hypothetical protein
VNVPNNHKVKFSEFSIISENKDPFIIRAIGRKEIWITLINNFIEISNIPLLIKAVNKKYQKENIIVSQFGLMKKVKVNGWNSISFEELNDIILQLKKISADENIRVYSR